MHVHSRPPAKKNATRHAAVRPLLVAVIDDHEDCRVGTCRLLEKHGIATCSFDSVAAFIASTKKHVIDCLLLDVRMPGIDGITLQQCLKQTNFDFPIIFCTGQEMDARLAAALDDGAHAVMKKPLRGEALVTAIREARRRHRSARPAYFKAR